MSSLKDAPKQDRQYLNYVTLNTMITKTMQEQQGRINIDHDLADALAWGIARKISSDVLIERAKTLTVDEILNHQTVKEANLSRNHDLPIAVKKYKGTDRGHNGANWGVLLGIVLLVSLLIGTGLAAL